MELNITRFVTEASPMDYSASPAELGQDAGRITWGNAIEDSADFMLLDSAEKLQAMRDHLRGFGAWDDDEIAAFSDTDLNALLIQCISGDLRDAGLSGAPTDAEWLEYEAGSSEGLYSSRIGRGDDGQVWYYLGD